MLSLKVRVLVFIEDLRPHRGHESSKKDKGSALGRLSLNQRTTPRWTIPELVEACARAGVPAVGLWREPVAEHGLDRTARLVRDAGLRVSSLCRGGFFTAGDPAERAAAIEDNRRAIDEAAALGTTELALVVGGLPPVVRDHADVDPTQVPVAGAGPHRAAGPRDLRAARDRVADAVAELVPYAVERGIRLALEPLHPMFCADRSVLSTLAEALTLAERHSPEAVGVVVDAYHVWWDPDLAELVARSGDRLALYQVCDWVVPLGADVLLSRGMMGDGHIDLPGLTAGVDAAGYRGDIEVEIFNADLWAADPDTVLATVVEAFTTHVTPGLAP